MKTKLATCGLALVLASCGGDDSGHGHGHEHGTGHTMEVPATVVSVDAGDRTIVVRGSGDAAGTGETRTLSVDPAASASLAGLSAGDQVTLTCAMSGGAHAGEETPAVTTETSPVPGGSRAGAPGGGGMDLSSCTSVAALRKR